MKKKKESLQDLIWSKEKENKLVYAHVEGFTSVDIDALIDSQPLDGLLYDLNRDAVTIASWIDHPEYGVKWVNDYAVYLVIKRLHERMTKAEKRVKELED